MSCSERWLSVSAWVHLEISRGHFYLNTSFVKPLRIKEYRENYFQSIQLFNLSLDIFHSPQTLVQVWPCTTTDCMVARAATKSRRLCFVITATSERGVLHTNPARISRSDLRKYRSHPGLTPWPAHQVSLQDHIVAKRKLEFSFSTVLVSIQISIKIFLFSRLAIRGKVAPCSISDAWTLNLALGPFCSFLQHGTATNQ